MSAPVVWFLFGAALWLAEVFSPVFVMFFFGMGAFAAALATLAGASLAVALGVFAAVSVLSLLLLRRLLVRTFQGNSRIAEQGEGGSSRRGRLGVVTRAIRPGEVGEISLEGSFWRAVGEETELAEGVAVEVLGHVPHDELLLQVRAHAARTTV